jgi:hypothetical protein
LSARIRIRTRMSRIHTTLGCIWADLHVAFRQPLLRLDPLDVGVRHHLVGFLHHKDINAAGSCLAVLRIRIRCLFYPGSGIRNRFFLFPDPRSRIPDIFDSLMTNFWVESMKILCVLVKKISFTCLKENYLQFYDICGFKK